MKKCITIDEVRPKKVYNISETARILGKHRQTVRTYIANGWITDTLVTLKPKRGKEGKTAYKRGVQGREIIRVYNEII